MTNQNALYIVNTFLETIRRGIPAEVRRVNDNNEEWSSIRLFFKEHILKALITDFKYEDPTLLQSSMYFTTHLHRNTCKFSLYIDFFFIIVTLPRSGRNWLKIAVWIDTLEACLAQLHSERDKFKLYFAIWQHFRKIKYLPCHQFGSKPTFYRTKNINNKKYLLIRNLSDYPEFW